MMALDLRKVPLLPFTLAVATGVTLALHVDLAASYMNWIAAGLFLSSVLLLWRTGASVLSLIAVLACFAVVGELRMSRALGRPVRAGIENLAAASGEITVSGRIDTPASDALRWNSVWLGSCILEDSGGGLLSLGALRVQLYADSAILARARRGDLVRARGTWRPGSAAAKLSSGALVQSIVRGEAADVFADSMSVFVDHRSGFHIVRAVEWLRTGLQRIYDRNLSPDGAALCKALVLGDREDFSPRFQDRLRLTGLSHVFALSGMNVGLLMTLFWTMLTLLCVPRTPRLWIILLLVLVYMELGREAPSLVRASLMAALWVIGQILCRKADILNIVSGAAFLELLWKPLHLLDAGFLLSYLAVLGLVGSFSFFQSLFRRLFRNPGHRAARFAVDLGAASAAAQIGTMPLVGFLFGRIPLLAVAGNVVAVFLFTILLIWAVLLLPVVLVLPPLASIWSAAIDGLAGVTSGFVNFFSGLPLASVMIPHLPPATVWILYSAMALVIGGLIRHERRWVWGGTLLLGNALVWSALLVPRQPACSISFLPVGNGDAILITTAAGRAVLVDAGPGFGEWSAAGRVLAVMNDRGIRRLDALILTHPDNDHIGGAPELIQRINVDRLLTNGIAADGFTSQLVHLAAQSCSIPTEVLSAGDRVVFDKDVFLDVLAPDSLTRAGNGPDNRKSIVMRLSAAGSTALLTGDIDSTLERSLLEWRDGLRAQLLKVSHHGSGSGSSDDFLSAVDPGLAVLSYGVGNRYGHPHPDVRERLRHRRVTVYETPRDGVVTFEAAANGWRHRPSETVRRLARWKIPYEPE